MKHYALILFFLVNHWLLTAQQPTAAYLDADVQWVSSFRWSHWRAKTPPSDWLRLGWVQSSLQSLQLNHWGGRSMAELEQLWGNPTLAGIDTTGFWHLASKRDSLGVAYYMLVMPMAQMGTWRTFIERSLPRFSQSEFKLGNGHFYIQREQSAWVWNRDRIMFWWYVLPLGVKYKPTYVQQKSFAESTLFPLLRASVNYSLQQNALFRQSLEKSADLYIWTNWGDSLTGAAQVFFERGRVRMEHQLGISSAAVAVLTNPQALAGKAFQKLLNRANGGLRWSLRFNPKADKSLAQAAQWLKQSPFFEYSNTLDSNVLKSEIVQKAWHSLQGVAVGSLTNFVLQTDSSVLPAFDVSVAHQHFKHVQAGLIELAKNKVILSTDENKTKFEYKYTNSWSWKIVLDKKWLHLTMSDAGALASPQKLTTEEITQFATQPQTVVLDGNSFFANWSAVLPAQHRLQPVLHTLKAVVDSYKFSTQKIENQQLHQTWELVLVNREADTWAQFLQLGNVFVLPSK